MSPIIATKATGPTTTPAMKALLFPGFGSGVGSGVMTTTPGAVVVPGVVVDGTFGDGGVVVVGELGVAVPSQ